MSQIEDGTGSGKLAKVNNENRLLVKAVTSENQHHVSEADHQAYQMSADIAIDITEQDLILIKNTSSTRNLIVTFIRLEVASAAAASEDAYFNVEIGGDYASGGTASVPINMNVGSGTSADGEFYDASGAAIVVSGTWNQIDRTYKDDNSYNKHGSLILPKNACLKISHKGSTAAGQAYCRVSFYLDANGSN